MSPPRSSRAVQGYFGAVAAATLAFAAQRNMAALLADSLYPLRPDHLVAVLAAVLVVAFATGVVALGPWLAVTRHAERVGIRNPWYYALWGAAAGTLLGPPVFALWPGFVTDGEAAPPWLYADRVVVDLLNIGSTFALSGAVGGIAYWWINGRRVAAQA